MFITLSIYSKNLNSLTNFLKFFYKLKTNKVLKLNFFPIQSQKNKKVFFLSVLQSPHVNKKSQEQFNYHTYNKQLKIHVSQIAKFLTIWKIVKIKLFPDIKLKKKIWLNNKAFKYTLVDKTDHDRFVLKFCQKSESKSNILNRTKFETFILKRSSFSNKTGGGRRKRSCVFAVWDEPTADSRNTSDVSSSLFSLLDYLIGNNTLSSIIRNTRKRRNNNLYHTIYSFLPAV